jgi:hypothetical protein
MSDRQLGDVMFQSDEDDVIRKMVHWQSPNIGIVNAGNECACRGKVFQVSKHLPHFSSKSGRDRFVALAVPLGRLT